MAYTGRKSLGTAAVLMADMAEFNKRKAKQKKDLERAKREHAKGQRDARKANEMRYKEITDLYNSRKKDTSARYDKSLAHLDEIEKSGLADIERQRGNQVGEVDARSIASGMYGVMGGTHDAARRRAGEDAQRASLRVRSEVGGMRSAAEERYGDMIGRMDEDMARFKERRTDEYPNFDDYYKSIGGAAEANGLNDFRSFSTLGAQYSNGGGRAPNDGADSAGGAQQGPQEGDFLTGTGPKNKNNLRTQNYEEWKKRFGGQNIRKRRDKAREKKYAPPMPPSY